LEINVQSLPEHETAAVIQLKGEFMLPDSEAFKVCAEQLFDKGKVHLILDMTQLTYIVSSGLGIVVLILKKARSLGGDLIFLKIQGGLVEGVFRMTRFNELIEMYDTVEQALAQIASS